MSNATETVPYGLLGKHALSEDEMDRLWVEDPMDPRFHSPDRRYWTRFRVNPTTSARERVEFLEKFAWDLTRHGGEISAEEVYGFINIACELMSGALNNGDPEAEATAAVAWEIGQWLHPSSGGSGTPITIHGAV